MTDSKKSPAPSGPQHQPQELVYMAHPAIGGYPATVSYAAFVELYKDRGWTLVPAAKKGEVFEADPPSHTPITPEEG